jgi:hypothetical protein
MSGLTRRTALLAGLALLVVTNGIVLGGVAWNRSAEDARLELGARELGLPYAGWSLLEEDSGASLHLAWRTPDRFPPEDHANWLDAAKLATLGFTREEAAKAGYGTRQQTREVFVALELAGPVWQRGIEALRAKRDHAAELAAAHPGDKDLARRAESAQSELENEEQRASRLVAVDAARDAAALRARWPDRTRYAILRGRVRAMMWAQEPTGYVASLTPTAIHVPAAILRGLTTGGTLKADAKLRAVIAFGRRYEPWIVSAAKAE